MHRLNPGPHWPPVVRVSVRDVSAVGGWGLGLSDSDREESVDSGMWYIGLLLKGAADEPRKLVDLAVGVRVDHLHRWRSCC